MSPLMTTLLPSGVHPPVCATSLTLVEILSQLNCHTHNVEKRLIFVSCRGPENGCKSKEPQLERVGARGAKKVDNFWTLENQGSEADERDQRSSAPRRFPRVKSPERFSSTIGVAELESDGDAAPTATAGTFYASTGNKVDRPLLALTVLFVFVLQIRTGAKQKRKKSTKIIGIVSGEAYVIRFEPDPDRLLANYSAYGGGVCVIVDGQTIGQRAVLLHLWDLLGHFRQLFGGCLFDQHDLPPEADNVRRNAGRMHARVLRRLPGDHHRILHRLLYMLLLPANPPASFTGVDSRPSDAFLPSKSATSQGPAKPSMPSTNCASSALRRRRDRRLAAEAVAAEVDNRCELTKSVSFLKAARRWNPGCCAAAPADVLTDISSTGYVGDVQGIEPEAPRWFTCRGVDKNHQLQLLDFRHVEQ
ncbi:conserved hypothetical protein [Culex quinquefasciatus]|uniref:Uncharacterized protein n=1 Tax=Culex quinquefasciatus TaxID=7176 RepID=B0WQ42_CULQU|nr:conserved hypothetical protein [Culex quinquefasciatus]|eukprot:XP_001850826.1 conserved hypothetical protein [Culex quinquefasciatus]